MKERKQGGGQNQDGGGKRNNEVRFRTRWLKSGSDSGRTGS